MYFLIFSHSFTICSNCNYSKNYLIPQQFLETSVIFISGLFSHPICHSYPRYVSIFLQHVIIGLSLQLYIFQIFSCASAITVEGEVVRADSEQHTHQTNVNQLVAEEIKRSVINENCENSTNCAIIEKLNKDAMTNLSVIKCPTSET